MINVTFEFFWEFFRLRIIFLSFSISIFFLIFYYFVYDTFNVLILIFRYFSLNLNPPLFIFMAAPWNIKFSLNSNFGLVWQKNLFFFFFFCLKTKELVLTSRTWSVGLHTFTLIFDPRLYVNLSIPWSLP